MAKRFEQYKVRRGDDLADPDFWNRIFEDLDLRLSLRELDSTRIDTAVEVLEAVALQRLNDTFIPLINEAKERLDTFGVTFAATSATSVTVGLGAKTFFVDEAMRQAYYYTDYVAIRAHDDATASMVAQVVSYDRPTGELKVNVELLVGSGTFAAWDIHSGVKPDTTHAGRTDNPHATTAAQVGAYTIAAADAAIAAAIASIPGVDLSSRLAKASNLSDLNDVATARVNLGLKALAILDTVGYGELASNIIATAANIRANAASKLIGPNAAWAAAAPVDLTTISGTVTLDLAAGLNFIGTHSASITLANPSNIKPGQCGGLAFTVSGAGAPTIGFGSYWKPLAKVTPSFGTANGAVNYISFQCISSTLIVFSGGQIV